MRLEGVTDEQLAFLGYILVEETDDTKLYYHLGDYVIVDKDDPFIFVHDHNDAISLGTEAISVPRED